MNPENYRTANSVRTIVATRGAVINVWGESTATLNGVAVTLQPRVDYNTVNRSNTYVFDETAHPNGRTVDYKGNVRIENA